MRVGNGNLGEPREVVIRPKAAVRRRLQAEPTMSGIACGICLILGTLIQGCGSETPTAERYDVFLLVVDTLRADHLGIYGYGRETSPSLDAFAASATVFADVFAPASWTLPSVGSVLTGTYPSLHGLRASEGARELVSMRSGVVTLAEAFREHGYRTAAVVANPWMTVRGPGLDRGFEEYHHDTSLRADGVHEVAERILDREDPRPLFLYLHYMDVHGPYTQESPGGQDLGPIGVSEWRFLKEEESSRIPLYLRLPRVRRLGEYVDAYDRGIRSWDDAFGRLVDRLRKSGRLDNTLISLVSDHGEEFLEHGGWNHGETLYQEQLFVPWILRLPGVPGGRVTEPVVSLIDIAPTLLSAAGLARPATMNGRDVLDAGMPLAPRALFSETEARLEGIADAAAAQVAVRRGRAKLIVSPHGRQCFDLARDPAERAPIVGDDPCDGASDQVIEAWRSEMRNAAHALGETTIHELKPEEREQLHELGYGE